MTQPSSSRSLLVLLLVVLLIGIGGLVYWQFGDQLSDFLGLSSGTSGTSTEALAITSVEVRNIGVASAEIFWKTNNHASAQVEYWITAGDVKTTELMYDPTSGQFLGAVEHIVTLKDLQADTTYHYRVKSKDKTGIEKTKEGDFKTQQMPSE
jgi:phosphodiesterase/alkaline phosphatase D-like protein